MLAVQLTKYNSKNPKLELRNVEPEKLGDEDLLVKMKATGVNPVDNLITHGALKLVVPYKLPQTMGNEFVGIVEKIGQNVSDFKVGDRIYARNPIDNIGAFAEKIIINQSAVAKVPDYLSDEEAACVPLTALTAMQALDILEAKPGETLFISGGTGSFGAMAIPLAVARGLNVITSGNGSKREEMEKLGVSNFIDYRKEDYTKSVSNVDAVIDTLGGVELEKQFTILKNRGKIVSLRAMPNKAFAQSMKMGKFKQGLFSLAAHKIEKIAKKKDQTYNFLFVRANGKQLKEASEILAKNNIHPDVGKVFRLNEYEAALENVTKRGNKGKTIIKN